MQTWIDAYVASRDWTWLAFGLVWAFAGGFIVAGLASWVRLTGRHEGPVPWRQRAQRGSVAWWLGVAAAAALVALSL